MPNIKKNRKAMTGGRTSGKLPMYVSITGVVQKYTLGGFDDSLDLNFLFDLLVLCHLCFWVYYSY
jgi:hypothetical protein